MFGFTPKMSFKEYEVLPKSFPIKKSNLKVGRKYFIETKMPMISNFDFTFKYRYENVILKGKFKKLIERPNHGGTVVIYAEFKSVKLIVDERRSCRAYLPLTFEADEKTIEPTIYREDHSPGIHEEIARQCIMVELKLYLKEKKMEPEDNPSICFIGEDYREARDRFKKC